MVMKNLSLYIDLAFCLFFLPLMVFLMPRETWMLEKYPAFFYLLVSWLYVIYIANRCLTIPLMFRGRWQCAVATVIILCSVGVTFLFTKMEMFLPLYEGPTPYSEQYPWRIVKLSLYRETLWLLFMVVEAFSFAVCLLTAFHRQQSQRISTEIALYKARLNPHFLFNTLNTLYGLLITRSEKTETAMEKFIGIARYMYSTSSRDFIPLGEEIEYMDEYIFLQKLRLNSLADVTFTHSEESGLTPVPPMLFITFVENAFKYGISSDEPCYVRIDIREGDGRVMFSVENLVFRQSDGNSAKMGIANCRRRLELLYPGRHSLVAGRTGENVFRVELELQDEDI